MAITKKAMEARARHAAEAAAAAAEDDQSWSLDTVFLTAGGETRSISDWQANDREVPTDSAQNDDGSITFEYDDITGHPGDVVVYTNGR